MIGKFGVKQIFFSACENVDVLVYIVDFQEENVCTLFPILN